MMTFTLIKRLLKPNREHVGLPVRWLGDGIHGIPRPTIDIDLLIPPIRLKSFEIANRTILARRVASLSRGQIESSHRENGRRTVLS